MTAPDINRDAEIAALKPKLGWLCYGCGAEWLGAPCPKCGGDGAVGTKKAPGPLYGVKTHMWSALAVAVVAAGRTGGH